LLLLTGSLAPGDRVDGLLRHAIVAVLLASRPARFRTALSLLRLSGSETDKQREDRKQEDAHREIPN
jgi:hypothetical protein